MSHTQPPSTEPTADPCDSEGGEVDLVREEIIERLQAKLLREIAQAGALRKEAIAQGAGIGLTCTAAELIPWF